MTFDKQFSNTNLKKSRNSKYCKENKNKSMEFSSKKNLCTTLNSSIKYIAEVVYQEIGEGYQNNQMSYENFESWISRNKGILSTFDKWLRKNIWSKDKIIRSSVDSIPEIFPGKDGYAMVNMKKKSNKIKFYKKMFLSLKKNILMIYSSSEKVSLANVYILKDINIRFDKWNYKIKVWHSTSKDYLNLTIVLKNQQDFLKWKDFLSPFILQNIEKFYLFRERIGRGNFSTVNLVQKRDDNSQKFAVKTIDKKKLKPNELNLIRHEAEIISSLNHENIIKFYHQFEDYHKTFYVLELVQGGDLLEYVFSKDKLDEQEARLIFSQLLEVVKYMHDKNILHRDLKPENILLKFSPESKKITKIKLIDFGFATYFCEDDLPNLSCGTLNYAAPEVLIGEEYDESSDLFSCGVILYFM